MKRVLLVTAMVLTLVSAWAIPAHKGAVQVLQPDGTSLTIQLNGDEFYSFVTTSDGYTILLTTQGAYEYARRDGQRLVTTGVIAHDPQLRSSSELAMLQGMSKRMTDHEAVGRSKAARTKRDAQPSHIQRYDYTKFKGLIILIEFSDVQFSMNDPVNFYDHMVNDEAFTGYVDDSGKQVNCTGSVRDYFDDQSGGLFTPHFDIVGPVSVSYKSTQANNNSSAIFRSALSQANSAVDYSQYDTDNNGVVDMVFFLCAGMSSSFTGNNSGLLWPHRSRLYGTSFDGKSFSDYACSTELYGWESQPNGITVEGIGTFCHEFSHVLGFPDFYDADYELSGGESHHPDEWDLMAGGSSANYSRTPCGYSIFERYSLGWANPPVLQEGSFTLNPLNTSNEGFILKSPVNNTFFMFENRQKTRWDAYLPGHGMLVVRVDSTWVVPWNNNSVNNNPDHNYYVLLRAGNIKAGSAASDPFPGTAGVMMISNFTFPSLKTWSGRDNLLMINNIKETSGVISFNVLPANGYQALVEDFEQMAVTAELSLKDVQGNFTTWNFTRSNVTAPGEDNCNGTNAVAMKMSTAITSVIPIYYNVNQAYFSVSNPTNVAAKFTLTYSVDDGNTWKNARTITNATSVEIPANSRAGAHWVLDMNNREPARYRITMSNGNKNNPCYLDDLMLFYTGEEGGPDEGVTGDVTGDGVVDISDVNAVINIMLGKAEMVESADVNGDGNVDISDVNAVINIMLGKA